VLKPIQGRNLTKNEVGNLKYGFPELHFLQSPACLRDEAGHFHHIL